MGSELSIYILLLKLTLTPKDKTLESLSIFAYWAFDGRDNEEWSRIANF